MHIVFLTNEYPNAQDSHGGIGSFVQNLGRNLVKKGIDVSVVGISNSSQEIVENDEGVTVHRLKKSTAKFAKFISNSNNICKKLEQIHSLKPIDIVEGSELSFAFLPKKTSFKKVIRMHGGHHFFAHTLGKKTAFWRAYQERKSFSKVDALIAVSEFVGSKTKELLGFKKPFKTIYNFIDLEKFKIDRKVVSKENSILFIGTICEKKGVKELIQAFELVKKEVPNAVLNLVGRDWNDENVGSYTTYVKSFIADENKDNIIFHGTISYSEIPKMIGQAQVCVYPSHAESFGLTLIEAMAIQKSIVAGNIEPFQEIMDENAGVFCNPFSPESIAEKLIYLLKNPSLADEFAIKAQKSVKEKFNAEKIVNENINFYKSIL